MADHRKTKTFIDSKVQKALNSEITFVFGCNTEAEAVYLRDTWLERIENTRPELLYECIGTKIIFNNNSTIEFVYPLVQEFKAGEAV